MKMDAPQQLGSINGLLSQSSSIMKRPPPKSTEKLVLISLHDCSTTFNLLDLENKFQQIAWFTN
jgi:hypothetical protein